MILFLTWFMGPQNPSRTKVESCEFSLFQLRLPEKRIQRRVFSTQYTRPLDPPAIAFSTKEGEAMFCEAIAGGTTFGSLKLIENFGMQRNLNFCGPATLCTVLNALRVDPE
ncbi:Glutathione gamma-glutamylcysteinyltransferase 1 [Camellia lanceoleosa]|uniref:Glutathione gamma-glutamylcysteinyltransferase 1 n=1 Tax=Camellia lanceoleosa TaxID=1840588 RepID=A0ACC0FGT7_9ERIC|nr:Glutathione gamma-glutamylcysteinyltransferase 1 [Camellia lanceoleosa]